MFASSSSSRLAKTGTGVFQCVTAFGNAQFPSVVSLRSLFMDGGEGKIGGVCL